MSETLLTKYGPVKISEFEANILDRAEEAKRLNRFSPWFDVADTILADCERFARARHRGA